MTFTFTGQVSVFGLGNGETSQAQEEQASTQPADGAGGTGSTEATETTETTGTDNQEMTTQAEETPDAGALAAGDENVIYQAANLKEAAASLRAVLEGPVLQPCDPPVLPTELRTDAPSCPQVPRQQQCPTHPHHIPQAG